MVSARGTSLLLLESRSSYTLSSSPQHCQFGHLRTCALDAPPTSQRRQKKFGAIYHFDLEILSDGNRRGGGEREPWGGRRGAVNERRESEGSRHLAQKKKKKGTKRLGQRIDFVLESPISLYHYYYCFSHHKLQDIFCTVLGGKQGVGGGEGTFKNLSHTKELGGPDSRRAIQEKVRIILNFGKSAAATTATEAIAASAFRAESRINNCFFLDFRCNANTSCHPWNMSVGWSILTK